MADSILPPIDHLLSERTTGKRLRKRLGPKEHRNGSTSTVFCTQYLQTDWHQRLSFGVHAEAVKGRVFHNTIRVETGRYNLREKIGVVLALVRC